MYKGFLPLNEECIFENVFLVMVEMNIYYIIIVIIFIIFIE